VVGSIVTAISDVIAARGFTPGVFEERSNSAVSLFEAVRLAHGMSAEDADVCYWNWRELRPYFIELWANLDLEASRLAGRPMKAVVWAYPEDRTVEQVLDLLSAVDEALGSSTILSGERRPIPSGMISGNKIRGALSTTIGVLAVATASRVNDVIRQVLDATEAGAADEALLSHLDDRVGLADEAHETRDTGVVSKTLSRYSLHLAKEVAAVTDTRQWTYRDFLEHLVSAERAGMSDHELGQWMTAQIRERASTTS
jgi:hypothetical protein